MPIFQCFPPVALRLASAIALLSLATACSTSSTAPTESPTFDLQTELAFCRDEINRYRASVGRTALARSQPLETFAADSARVDGLAHVAHQHFGATSGGGGVSAAETEILWWNGFSVHTVIHDGLAQMWTAGASGEHYAILTGAFAQVGCGISVNAGEVTVTEDFR